MNSHAEMPVRRAIKATTMEVEKEMRDALVQRLAASSEPCAIAFDGWTNVVQSKVTNIVLVCEGRAFYWCSIANRSERNTAAWMQQAMHPHIDELLSRGVRLAGFIADNESVNTALFNLLTEKYPFFIRVPCAAHTVQLVVKSSMATERWKRVRDGVEELLKAFALKDPRQQLMTLQQTATNSSLNLIKPNDTRWNSFLFACVRMLKLRDFIQLIHRREDSFWSEMQALVDFLLPFQIATDVLQKDAATLYDIFQQWNILTKHILANTAGPEQRHSMSALRQRWSGQVNNEATMSTAVLALDLKLDGIMREDIDAAKKFIVNWGATYLSFFKLSSHPSVQLKGLLWVQLGHLATRKEAFAELDERISMTKLAIGVKWNALTVWASYDMELAVVARALLSIPASEASVERSFSAQDSIHTKKRNSLHDATVQASMFIAFNTRALASSSAIVRRETELSVDFMETDTESQSDSDDEPVQLEEKFDDEMDVDIDDASADEQLEEVPAEELRRTYSE
ncbi:MAG: DUF domain-containing protein, partial [Candidatus Pacebacteria bacterium]|nr:DUF domain-containing protein [Candidatus Paceibacterota bacterium]